MKKLKYRIVIQWSDEDNCYLVGLPDFPGQKWRTHGNTYAESVKNAEEVRLEPQPRVAGLDRSAVRARRRA